MIVYQDFPWRTPVETATAGRQALLRLDDAG